MYLFTYIFESHLPNLLNSMHVNCYLQLALFLYRFLLLIQLCILTYHVVLLQNPKFCLGYNIFKSELLLIVVSALFSNFLFLYSKPSLEVALTVSEIFI